MISDSWFNVSSGYWVKVHVMGWLRAACRINYGTLMLDGVEHEPNVSKCQPVPSALSTASEITAYYTFHSVCHG